MGKKCQAVISAWACVRFECFCASLRLSIFSSWTPSQHPPCYSFQILLRHKYTAYRDRVVPGAAKLSNCLSWPEHLAERLSENQADEGTGDWCTDKFLRDFIKANRNWRTLKEESNAFCNTDSIHVGLFADANHTDKVWFVGNWFIYSPVSIVMDEVSLFLQQTRKKIKL